MCVCSLAWKKNAVDLGLFRRLMFYQRQRFTFSFEKGFEMIKLLLAKKFKSEKHDPAGMWMSEKLDGVRAYWSAQNRKLYTRTGNPIHAPTWFTDDFPTHDCDGEIHGSRDSFQKVQGIVRSKNSNEWSDLIYSIFDDCGAGTYRERYDRLELLDGNHFCRLAQYNCHSEADLMNYLSFIEDQKGEGVMLRDPDSSYINGRSETLLKVKRIDDAEAVVVDHVKSESDTEFRAIVCLLMNGITFRIGSGFSEEDRKLGNPAVGSTITFRHHGFTDRGVPRFASFFRTRELV